MIDGLKSLGKALAKHAPAMARVAMNAVPGGAVGQMLAGEVMRRVTEEVGKDVEGDPHAVAARLSEATPEQWAAIRQADADFQVEMRKVGVERARVDAGDRADARAAASSRGRAVTALAYLIVVGFLLMSGAVIYFLLDLGVEPSATANSILFAVFGYLAASMQSVVSFFYGSSASSESMAERATDRIDR